MLDWRLSAAGLASISFIAVLSPVLIVVLVSVRHAAIQLRDENRFAAMTVDLPTEDVIIGLSLSSLWRIRWPIVISVALMPTFIISLLRLEIGGYVAWQASAEMLGAATAASEASRLLLDGRIPYLRLIVRAASGGLLTWAILPLMTVIGIGTVLILRDASLSALVALLAQIGIGSVIFGIWSVLARTPLLGGTLELVRVVLIIAMLGGVLVLAVRLARWATQFLTFAAPEVDGTL